MLNDAQRDFVEKNFNLCYECAHRHIRNNETLYRYGWDFDDLVSLASLALCRAAEVFDPSKGYKFTTLFFRIWNNAVAFEVRRMFSLKRYNPAGVLSYDRIVNDETGATYLDMIESDDDTPETAVIRNESRQKLNQFISELSGTQEKVFYLYHSGMKQKEVSSAMGISQSYASRILGKTYRRLEKQMADLGYCGTEV